MTTICEAPTYGTVKSAHHIPAMEDEASVARGLEIRFTDDEIENAVESALRVGAGASAEEAIATTEGENLVQREEVIRVLDRVSRDADFWRELWERGSEALDGYRLSREAKAAIVLSDIRWIREHVGDLSEDQLKLLYKRLEREVW